MLWSYSTLHKGVSYNKKFSKMMFYLDSDSDSSSGPNSTISSKIVELA